jgi:hypothetical protein
VTTRFEPSKCRDRYPAVWSNIPVQSLTGSLTARRKSTGLQR